ncbi:MAG: radical SAM protein, partial [bacterium]|nr:radical SAM protein [bacterium]
LNECDVSFVDTLDFVRGKVGREKLSQLGTMIEGEYVTIKNRAAPSAEELNIEPDYCDLPIGEYSALGEVGTYRCWLPNNFKASSVLSNRGCRAHCSFCSVANFNGKGVRQRDVESVLDEIQHLKEHHGVNHIAWIDDDLFFNKTRAVALFEGIKNRNLNITWCASNGVIASATSSAPELLKAAVDSGCIGITFGVESGNDEILKDVHKPSGVKHFLKVGEMMKEYPRVFTRGFLIIGFPNEKLSQIKDTISLANKMDLDWYGIQLLSPLPNTEIYKTMVQLGIITDKEFEKNSDKDGNKFFTLRQGEKQRKEEEEGAKQATSFINVLDTKPDSHIPTREELHELWLVVDFLINYKPVLELQDLPKLKKKQAILRDICNRFTKANPLANLTLSIVEDRLGDKVQAEYRRSLTSQYLSSSAYWRTRFEAFDLYKWLGNETKIIISENPDESFKADDLRKSGGYVV